MRWLPGKGYAFSKVFGLLLVSYLLWLGAITGVLANNLGGIVFALAATAGLSAWAAFSQPARGARGFREGILAQQ